MEKYSQFIIQALTDAKQVATKHYSSVTGSVKPGQKDQVLTVADVEIGKLLIARIEQAFPDHNIIDEEAGVINKASRFTWVTDPIDGTSNFAVGLPAYGIMIGLLDGDTPVAGGVALPYYNEIYSATKGNGAFCNGEKITVSPEVELGNILAAYQINGTDPGKTRSEMPALAELIIHIRNLRTTNSVYDVMVTASGKYGACLNSESKIWDNVAQQIIIEEAGGLYTDFWGKPTDYTDPLQKAQQHYTFCAAAPKLHTKLQVLIHEEEM